MNFIEMMEAINGSCDPLERKWDLMEDLQEAFPYLHFGWDTMGRLSLFIWEQLSRVESPAWNREVVGSNPSSQTDSELGNEYKIKPSKEIR